MSYHNERSLARTRGAHGRRAAPAADADLLGQSTTPAGEAADVLRSFRQEVCLFAVPYAPGYRGAH